MSKFTVVASIRARADRIPQVQAELEKLVSITRGEEGCLQYDLHQDLEDPTHFLFYENWETREHWEAHTKAPHLVAYKAATEDDVARSELYLLNGIG